MKEVNAKECGRENDLIGFLYGELDAAEALAFQHHLRECAVCKTELAGFGEVRESVVAWRNESLGSAGYPVQITAPSPTRAARRRPSAMAALREFFTLSPLWMKGAMACAAILFCVLAGLAVAHLRTERVDNVAQTPTTAPAASAGPKEIKALVDQQVKEELARRKIAEDEQRLAENSALPKNPSQRNGGRGKVAERSASFQPARRPLSKTEREQLATDLRLVSAKNESELELLDDTLNQ
jgi:anti-sigma factor RsiW